MKYLYLLSLMLSSLLLCKSQSQDYQINLEKQVISLPGRSFYITQILDARPVKSHVGQVQRGMTNTKVNAVFKESLEKELSTFLTKSFPAQDGLQPIIVKVLSFKVSEHTTATSEKATAQMALDFIYRQGNFFYTVHRATGIAHSKGLDVTAAHNNN